MNQYSNRDYLNELKIHIGEIYGDYEIIDVVKENTFNDTIYKYKCKCKICGHEIEKNMYDLKNHTPYHSATSCKEDYLIYYCNTENKSDYTFIGKSEKKYHYDFKCKVCGNIISLTPSEFIKYNYNHCSKNCGSKVYLEEIGKIYDDYKVIEYLGPKIYNKGKTHLYKCECQICHRQRILDIGSLHRHSGTTHKSCASIIFNQNLPYISEFNKKWYELRERTTNSNNDRYFAYGGRGISSEAFKYFIDFFDAMYSSFIEHIKLYGIENTTIERIDVDGDYCPENCKWDTWKEQNSNRRSTLYFKTIDAFGNINYYRNLCDYCREKDIETNMSAIRDRIAENHQDIPINGLFYEKISKEEYNQNKKISICKIVSDEDKEKYLKLLKEEMNNV